MANIFQLGRHSNPHAQRHKGKLRAQKIHTAVLTDTVTCLSQKVGLILIACIASLGIFLYSQEKQSNLKLFRYYAVCLHECRLCVEGTGCAGGLW